MLFVQPFQGGTLAPKNDGEGIYVLTLNEVAAQTIYFSDRPDRIVGLVPTQVFLDSLGFTPDNPPNAAIVAQRADAGHQEVLIVELLNPAYDGSSLTYEARVLADYGHTGFASLPGQQLDYELGETIGEGSLFIDDLTCPRPEIECVDYNRHVAGYYFADYCLLTTGPNDGMCGPCEDPVAACAAAFPEKCNVGGCTWRFPHS